MSIPDPREISDVKIVMLKGEKGDKGDPNEWGNIEGNIADQTDLQTALDEKVNVSDIKDNTTSQDTDKPLSARIGYELQAEIDNLKARGRFLSLWNCTTGLPSTNPVEMPYSYKAGDYYIVSSVGTTNYMPTGPSYDGTASTTPETLEVKAGDFYEYDGTNWLLLFNTQKTVSFSQLAGNPSDNQALASALNGKVNTSDIYNALNKITAGAVLDARQGKVLNDAINAIIGNIYYNANTERSVEDNRIAVMNYLLANHFKKGSRNTAVVRYSGGHYFSYLYCGEGGTGSLRIIEFQVTMATHIAYWNIEGASATKTWEI